MRICLQYLVFPVNPFVSVFAPHADDDAAAKCVPSGRKTERERERERESERERERATEREKERERERERERWRERERERERERGALGEVCLPMGDIQLTALTQTLYCTDSWTMFLFCLFCFFQA